MAQNLHERHIPMNTLPDTDPDGGPILPEDVPVTMPELPRELMISTEQQFKAIADPVRTRILGIIQNQPATAKQIADKLKLPPGTVGHHLQVLEAAGLAKIVARRLVRGIVAKYYTRTARIFGYNFPPEVRGHASIALDFAAKLRDELADTLAAQDDADCKTSFPRARLSSERFQVYLERVKALVDDFMSEPAAPDGQVYSLFVALFLAPPYLQGKSTVLPSEFPTPDENE
jgi:DNA-binding transcriptional ArsR family regulator